MSIIPNVADVIRASKKTREVNSHSRGPSFQRIEKAGVEFKEFLKKELCEQLEYQCYADLRLKKLGSYQGLPGDILLYGHRKTSLNNVEDWYQRSDLGLQEMPFRTLQREFLEQGWYLIEETDPSISREFVFKVYAGEPKNHPYYNKQTLWHYNNFVYSRPEPKVVEKEPKVSEKELAVMWGCDPASLYPSLLNTRSNKVTPPSWHLDDKEFMEQLLSSIPKLAKPAKVETPKVAKPAKVETPKVEKRKRPVFYVCTTKDEEPEGADFRRFKLVNPEKYGFEKKVVRCHGRTLLEAAKRVFILICDTRPKLVHEMEYIGEIFALQELKKGCVGETFEFRAYRTLLEKKLYIISKLGRYSDEVAYEYGVTQIKKEEYDSMPELVDSEDGSKEEKEEKTQVEEPVTSETKEPSTKE